MRAKLKYVYAFFAVLFAVYVWFNLYQVVIFALFILLVFGSLYFVREAYAMHNSEKKDSGG